MRVCVLYDAQCVRVSVTICVSQMRVTVCACVRASVCVCVWPRGHVANTKRLSDRKHPEEEGE